jgi:hypothetical protein
MHTLVSFEKTDMGLLSQSEAIAWRCRSSQLTRWRARTEYSEKWRAEEEEERHKGSLTKK